MEIYDDSLIIITSDHGEEFKEHGDFEHTAKLYDELLRVPLIIKMPGNMPRKKVDGLCSLQDLAPTILSVLKLPGNQDFRGASLLSMVEDEETGRSEVLSVCGFFDDKNHMRKRRVSLRTKRWKYIFNEGEKDELYNLLDDPRERKNMIETNLDKAEEFRSKLLMKLPEINCDLETPYYTAEEKEELKRRLSDLGYM